MGETAIRVNLQATVELISPLHVGSGAGPLLSDYDFAAQRGVVWVMDQARLLERYTDEELRHGTPEIRLSMRLRPEEYAGCAAYSLPSQGDPGGQILPCIKTVEGRPYLPGSSLKGALRTVIAWEAARTGEGPKPEQMGRSAKYAASTWERSVFGRSPNLDLMRALLVDDTGPAPLESLELATVSVYSLRGEALESKGPGYRFSVEALKPGTRLNCRVGIGRGLFSEPSLGMAERRGWIEQICALGRARAAELIEAEVEFYSGCRLQPLTRFYRQLSDRLATLGENQTVLQLSWGAGWRAKTLGRALSDGEGFAGVRGSYGLGRPGAPFPKSRRLVERGGVPSEPMGWAEVTL
jgi:CRISPR-associated protein Csm5